MLLGDLVTFGEHKYFVEFVQNVASGKLFRIHQLNGPIRTFFIKDVVENYTPRDILELLRQEI